MPGLPYVIQETCHSTVRWQIKMVVIKKRVEKRERGPSNPPKFLQFYRVLALEHFTHPVLVPAPSIQKNSRFTPDGIYVENYGNSMVCNWNHE